MNEPTFEVLMEDLQLACGKLVIALVLDALKLVMLFLRFMLWLNG